MGGETARHCTEQHGEKEKAATRKKERNRGEKEGNQQQKQRFREEQMDGQGMTALKTSNCLPI